MYINLPTTNELVKSHYKMYHVKPNSYLIIWPPLYNLKTTLAHLKQAQAYQFTLVYMWYNGWKKRLRLHIIILYFYISMFWIAFFFFCSVILRFILFIFFFTKQFMYNRTVLYAKYNSLFQTNKRERDEFLHRDTCCNYLTRQSKLLRWLSRRRAEKTYMQLLRRRPPFLLLSYYLLISFYFHCFFFFSKHAEI